MGKCSCCGKHNDGAYGKCDSCTTRDKKMIGNKIGSEKLPRTKLKDTY